MANQSQNIANAADSEQNVTMSVQCSQCGISSRTTVSPSLTELLFVNASFTRVCNQYRGLAGLDFDNYVCPFNSCNQNFKLLVQFQAHLRLCGKTRYNCHRLKLNGSPCDMVCDPTDPEHLDQHCNTYRSVRRRFTPLRGLRSIAYSLTDGIRRLFLYVACCCSCQECVSSGGWCVDTNRLTFQTHICEVNSRKLSVERTQITINALHRLTHLPGQNYSPLLRNVQQLFRDVVNQLTYISSRSRTVDSADIESVESALESTRTLWKGLGFDYQTLAYDQVVELLHSVDLVMTGLRSRPIGSTIHRRTRLHEILRPVWAKCTGRCTMEQLVDVCIQALFHLGRIADPFVSRRTPLLAGRVSLEQLDQMIADIRSVAFRIDRTVNTTPVASSPASPAMSAIELTI